MGFDQEVLDRYRGKRLDTGEWVYGNLVKKYTGTMGALSILCYIVDAGAWGEKELINVNQVDPDSVGRCTGYQDVNRTVCIYEGDRVRSIFIPERVFTIKYGPHRAWCELDHVWSSSVGFYAEAEDGEQYPISDLSTWAERVEE